MLRPRDEPAEDADRLRERPHLDIHSAVQAEVVDGPAPVLAQHPRRVGVVDHHDGAVLVRDLDQRWKRCDVAVHREHAVGDQELVASRRLRLGEERVGRGRVLVREDLDLGPRQSGAVDDRGVIEGVGEDRVVPSHQSGDGAQVGQIAGGEEDGVGTALEAGQGCLQFLVETEAPGDEAGRPRPRPPAEGGITGGGRHLGVGGQS